ncbi:ADP-ribosylglycohydrolase family protein [Pseudomonas sp. NPDC007930]|uniref:ADP-ribosylglycohydrolase family protein n=1 Tax=Pseudomonas sp. NPDC007930 TaxID=3364417 RepID=UPI0036ED2997
MAALTSNNAPLQIHSVRYPGELGMTLCPGKHQPGAASGHFLRDLQQDLDLIKAWGAAAVVTLMPSTELATLQVARLGEQVEARDMLWFHLPIEDQQLPGDDFERAWVYAGVRLRQLIAAGSKVLLHCRSGLGRSGLIAARLLIELGMSDEDAERKVQAARPGTLVRPQQLAWLGQREVIRNDPWMDRVLGCLLGGAVGDAFGYEVEFDRLARIKQRFGPAGITRPVYHQGQLVVSDDTQMTLFTLEGLLRCSNARGELQHGDPLEEVRHACLDWLESQNGGDSVTRTPRGHLAAHAALRVRRAPGNTCLSALAKGGRGTLERPVNDSKGCGGVMRTAPIGLLAHADHLDLGARAAAQTHGHVDGWMPAGILARIVARLASGEEKFLAVRHALDDASVWAQRHGVQFSNDRYVLARELARKMRYNPELAIARLGEGWVGDEALAIALYSFLSAHDFSDAIRRASNHDGDSDSTASIAGQLWGAACGMDDLPHSWVRRLDVFDEVLQQAEQMRHWQRPASTDASAPPPPHGLEPGIRLLEMTQELHSMGYQRLRLFPYMAASGCHWRIEWVPVEAFKHGTAEPPATDNPRLVARYSTGAEWAPFGWQNAEALSPQQMARQFVQQFPELALAGHGQDWPYAGWLSALLGEARKGHLPYMLADDEDFSVEHGVPLFGGERFPLPPAFGAVGSAEKQAEPEETPEPAAFDFSDLYSRSHGLAALYHKGDAWLLQTTQLIWQQLPEPKARAATRLCALNDHPGSGKRGLHQLLERFMQLADDACAQAAGQADEEWVQPDGQMDWRKVHHTFARMDEAVLAQGYWLSEVIERVIRGQEG